MTLVNAPASPRPSQQVFDLIPVALELGRKSLHSVFDAANVETAACYTIGGMFECSAGSPA